MGELQALATLGRDDGLEARLVGQTAKNGGEAHVVLDDQQDAVGRLQVIAVVLDVPRGERQVAFRCGPLQRGGGGVRRGLLSPTLRQRDAGLSRASAWGRVGER